MNTTKHDSHGAVAGQVDCRVRPWPLGICAEMDAHAERQGLAHWSATNATSNEWWVRRDGLPHRCKWDTPGGYPGELRAMDIAEPPRPWVFGA